MNDEDSFPLFLSVPLYAGVLAAEPEFNVACDNAGCIYACGETARYTDFDKDMINCIGMTRGCRGEFYARGGKWARSDFPEKPSLMNDKKGK